MKITLWEPFKDLEDFQQRIDRMFGAHRRRASRGYPPVDLIDADDKLIIWALLPGMKREDIDLSVLRDKVTLSGERKREAINGASYLQRERGYGAFHKVIELPEPIQVEKANAEYENGVLRVVMPKERFSGPINISID